MKCYAPSTSNGKDEPSCSSNRMPADFPLSFTALLLDRFKKDDDWLIEMVEAWLTSKTSVWLLLLWELR